MPLFYLHIYDAGGGAQDEFGAYYLDLEAARAVAVNGIRSLLAAEILEGEINFEGRIEIVDASGMLLETIRFADAVSVVAGGSQYG